MQTNLLRHPAIVALTISLFSLATFSPSAFSQDKKEDKKETSDAETPDAEEKSEDEEGENEGKFHKVESGLFEIKVELEGAFESKKATPIAIEPKSWADLTVLEAVPHGTRVKEGDVLARFDDEKLKIAIEDLKVSVPLAEQALATADAELDALEKSTPLDLEGARRDKDHAEENLKYFEDVTLAMKKKGVDENLKRTQQGLAYAEEELNQLKKMYKADDLTEETEEIILERAQNQVDSIKWALEQAKAQSDRTLKTLIPRERDALKLGLDKTLVSWQTTEKSTKDALDKKRLDVAKAHRDHEKGAEKLADLEADLALLTVKAPHDGIVYYGAASRGKWITAAVVEKKLVQGGKVAPQEIIVTVVDPGQQQIRVSVPEAKLKHLKPGIEGSAAPVWNADAELKTAIESISYVPFADRTFDAVFTAPETKDEDQIFPGMGAKISLEIYKKEEALTVPKKAIEKEGDNEFVTLKDGKKQPVKTGKSNGKVTEILEGLKAGDEIKISD